MSGVIDFSKWSGDAFGERTPWGTADSAAVTTAVESELERPMSAQIMRTGAKPAIRQLDAGTAVTTQGEAATEIYLILAGVFVVEVDGEPITEIGPGAVVGERAALEGGVRTATLRAVTKARVAEAAPDQLQPVEIDSLAEQHRREQADLRDT